MGAVGSGFGTGIGIGTSTGIDDGIAIDSIDVTTPLPSVCDKEEPRLPRNFFRTVVVRENLDCRDMCEVAVVDRRLNLCNDRSRGGLDSCSRAF